MGRLLSSGYSQRTVRRGASACGEAMGDGWAVRWWDGTVRLVPTMGVAVSLMGFRHGQSEITVTPLASSATTSVQLTFVFMSKTLSPVPSPVLSSSV